MSNPRARATRHQDIADVGEFQSFLGVLLNDDDGLVLLVLKLGEDFEHHVDEARLKTDGRLIYQQHLRVHYKRAADLKQRRSPPERTLAGCLRRTASRG